MALWGGKLLKGEASARHFSPKSNGRSAASSFDALTQRNQGRALLALCPLGFHREPSADFPDRCVSLPFAGGDHAPPSDEIWKGTC